MTTLTTQVERALRLDNPNLTPEEAQAEAAGLVRLANNGHEGARDAISDLLDHPSDI